MQAVIHPPWHFVSCALHISYISTVTVYSMSYSFPNFETLHCSMSSFLTCIQVSQETGKVAWYSHFLKNFPQFSVIHTVKDFIIVNEAELDVFWKSTPGPTIFFFFFFLMIQWMLAICSLVSLLFINTVCTSRSSQFTYC